MPGNGEAVGLIPYPLQQAKSVIMSVRHYRARTARLPQKLPAGLPCFAFGYTEQRNTADLHFFEQRFNAVYLAFSTINQQQARKVVLFLHAGKMPAYCLLKCCVIIARLNITNGKAPIPFLQQPLVTEDHTGCVGCFALGMTDIETLYSRRRCRKPEKLRNLLQLEFIILPTGQVGLGSSAGIFFCHMQPFAVVTAGASAVINATPLTDADCL